jgi:hypothetical protein
VPKGQKSGYYTVHPQPSGDLYMVKVKKEQQMKETLAERNDRYIREGRTVSGGDGNGPGKPGYLFLALSGVAAIDNPKINELADQGYSFEAVVNGSYILLANYKKD